MASASIAGLFPGQGSHTDGMREQVQRALPELFEEALELVGEDPFDRAADSTRFAQPAIFCASLAGWQDRDCALRPLALAGHSLGELTALTAAGALDHSSGLRLAVLRGTLMEDCCADGQGGMLAVIGGTSEQLEGLLARHGLVLANENDSAQRVLAGPRAGIGAAAAELREQGLKALVLDVAGAFHSPAMQGAVEPFRTALEDVPLRAPEIPVFSCMAAAPFSDVRAELAAAITRPVRWRETMLALAAAGANTFVDFGPGRVLARLVRRNLPEAAVADPAAPPATVEVSALGR